jgi:hypothetical protein
MYSESMTLVIPPGYAHVLHSLRWAGDPEPMAITYGIEVGEGETAEGAADAAASAFSQLNPSMSTEISLFQTVVRHNIGPAGAPPIISTNVDFTTGVAGGALFPQNTAFLIHKRGPIGGRGGRGRFYIPAVREVSTNNVGAVNNDVVNSWNQDLANFLAALNSAPEIAGMVVLHDSLSQFAGAPPAPVSSLICDVVVATMRRRLRR